MFFICFAALKKVKTEGASTRIKPIKPIDLLPQEKNKFFRYRGSFTTPTIDVPDVYENLQTLGPSMCFNHNVLNIQI